MFNHFIIFFVSLFCIILELFFTRILYLKAWNHVVYIVIPFAILGYGIGANILLIVRSRIDRQPQHKVIGCLLIVLSIMTILSTWALVYLPIKVEYLVNIFVHPKALYMLFFAYTLFMMPFIFIGFLVVYLFVIYPQNSARLYLFDLLGAGAGAALFFPFINHFAVVRSLMLLSVMCLLIGSIVFFRKYGRLIIIFCLFLLAIILRMSEPFTYTVDHRKGWEYIPGYFKQNEYELMAAQWHPLGRTDAYRMNTQEVRDSLYRQSIGTFEINVEPRPEFSYLSTNFLAGTPVYNLSAEGLEKNQSRIFSFSQGMEVPYVILEKPKVVIIGAGGGRDIFMAHSHGAAQIWGAEINPAIYQMMSEGGLLYDYSGKVYTMGNTHVYNVDGRHLVKTIDPFSMDLIVLNGVDTFSGLSSGAYAYAESYLYTKNAVVDYLRILKEDGLINFNRWLFPEMPREELRLQAIIFDALKEAGYDKPWEHLIVGAHHTWSIFLIKKTPFTSQEKEKIKNYFSSHQTLWLYPGNQAGPDADKNVLSFFDQYAQAYQEDNQAYWVRYYPYDISVVTDDNPFFYKYYKFSSFNPFKSLAVHHTGTVVFLTQTLAFIQAIVFIFLFILLPLWLFKRQGISHMRTGELLSFLVYFSCLGIGFMFIEIPLMQKFVLLLGSPIHSIGVVLAILLISTGIGSGLLPRIQRFFTNPHQLIISVMCCLFFYLGLVILAGTPISDCFMPASFFVRVVFIAIFLLPLGVLLGLYFPLGLQIISSRQPLTVPWAWGINCGFSVLGSILSIILAQFFGFNAILTFALVAYLVASLVLKYFLPKVPA